MRADVDGGLILFLSMKPACSREKVKRVVVVIFLGTVQQTRYESSCTRIQSVRRTYDAVPRGSRGGQPKVSFIQRGHSMTVGMLIHSADHDTGVVLFTSLTRGKLEASEVQREFLPSDETFKGPFE